MSDLLSATLAPVRVTEATKRKVGKHADTFGLSEADIVRLALHNFLNDANCPACQAGARLRILAGDA